MFEIEKIIKFIKKNFSKRDVIIIIILLGLYFITRLVNLDKWPIFTDEGIYIRWAKTAWHDASWRFISLTDGRQPLHTWGMIPFLKLFPNNPLLGGRMFSVFSGLLALIGFFITLFYLFGKKGAYIGSFLYITLPFFLFYDRMALIDSMVNAGFIWMFFTSVLLANTLNFGVALLFGLETGMFLLAKSSVKLFLLLSGLAVFFIFFQHKLKIKKRFYNTVSFLILYSASALLAFIIYNIQRLSPYFHFVSQKNHTFVLTMSELLHNPLQVFFKNIRILPVYVSGELGWTFIPFFLVGLFWLFKKKKDLFYYWLGWILLSYVAISLIAKVVFPRYLLFMGGLVLIPLAYYFVSLKSVKKTVLSLIILLCVPLYFNYIILYYPKLLPFPEIDKGQYVKGITAGWEIKEILNIARDNAKEKPVILLAEGDFGVVGDMLSAELTPNDKNIWVKGYWPLDKKILVENQKYLKDHYVFVVFSHNQNPSQEWPIKEVEVSKRGVGDKSIHLFELIK